MKKIIVTLLATVLLVGALTLPAAALSPQGGRDNRLTQTLNLTPEQQQKLLDIRQTFQRDTLPIRQHMQRTRLELKQLWAAPQLDQSQIQGKVKEKTDLQIQLVQKRRDLAAKIKAVLTPDQLKTFEKYQNRFRDGLACHRFAHPLHSDTQAKPANQ